MKKASCFETGISRKNKIQSIVLGMKYSNINSVTIISKVSLVELLMSFGEESFFLKTLSENVTALSSIVASLAMIFSISILRNDIINYMILSHVSINGLFRPSYLQKSSLFHNHTRNLVA